MIDLRLGDYREVLADVTCDVMCADPPYSWRTHDGHGAELPDGRRDLDYSCWTADDVREFVAWAVPRTRWWFLAMTDDELVPVYRATLESHGWLTTTAAPWIARRKRHIGDMPPSWSVPIIVGRPPDVGATFAQARYLNQWHHLPGGYDVPQDDAAGIGGKPLSLLLRLLTDYTRRIESPVVCDPTSGERPTTAIACRKLGFEFVGAEVNAAKYRRALERLGTVERVDDLPLFGGGAA